MIALTHTIGQTYAVFGLARSGLAAARALVAGGAQVRVWDDGEAARLEAEKLGFQPLPLYDAALSGCNALVLAPGVPLTHPSPHAVVMAAERVGVPVIGDIELLRREVQTPFIGITGTNGKSTTSALIAHIFAEAGRAHALGGNIGRAALDLPRLEGDAHYILEMSTFQIDLTPSWQAKIGVLLNITVDHLDRHGTMENYAAIKARIFDGQSAGDTAVIGIDDEYCRAIRASRDFAMTGAKVIPISAENAPADGIGAVDGELFDRGEKIADLARFPRLPGKHNGQNIAAAYAACQAAGIARETILMAIATFPGLPHRLEKVGEINGIPCINDSKATNAEATEKALACFDPIYWIAGGKPKAGGIDSLGPYFGRIRHAFLIGEAAENFGRRLGPVPHSVSGTLDKALAEAVALSGAEKLKGAVILLSPACASYDQFKSFEHRGDEFRRLVAQHEPGEAAA